MALPGPVESVLRWMRRVYVSSESVPPAGDPSLRVWPSLGLWKLSGCWEHGGCWSTTGLGSVDRSSGHYPNRRAGSYMRGVPQQWLRGLPIIFGVLRSCKDGFAGFAHLLIRVGGRDNLTLRPLSVAAGDCARQRSGADQRSQVLVVGASGCTVTIHRSGQTHPKCLGRKLPGSGTPVSTSMGSPVWQTLGRRLNLGASITIASGLTVLYRTGLRRRCGKNGRRPMEKTAPREPWKTLRVSHFPTGPTTINCHSGSGPDSGGRSPVHEPEPVTLFSRTIRLPVSVDKSD